MARLGLCGAVGGLVLWSGVKAASASLPREASPVQGWVDGVDVDLGEAVGGSIPVPAGGADVGVDAAAMVAPPSIVDLAVPLADAVAGTGVSSVDAVSSVVGDVGGSPLGEVVGASSVVVGGRTSSVGGAVGDVPPVAGDVSGQSLAPLAGTVRVDELALPPAAAPVAGGSVVPVADRVVEPMADVVGGKLPFLPAAPGARSAVIGSGQATESGGVASGWDVAFAPFGLGAEVLAEVSAEVPTEPSSPSVPVSRRASGSEDLVVLGSSAVAIPAPAVVGGGLWEGVGVAVSGVSESSGSGPEVTPD